MAAAARSWRQASDIAQGFQELLEAMQTHLPACLIGYPPAGLRQGQILLG